MNKKVLIIIGVVVVAGIVLAYVFSINSAENVAEKAISSATNGAVDVDIDGKTLTVNTETGSIQAGENVDLPDDFPSDVYVVDGDLQSALQTPGNNGFQLSISTSKSLADVKSMYQQELESEGWTITSSLDLGVGFNLFAEKGSKITTVTISEVEGKTQIVLTTGDNN